MSEMDDNVVPHARVRSLRDAVRKARLAEVERDDAIEERRETEVTRLDLLLEDLKAVIDEIPTGDERFVFEITRGTAPRLWVDATAHVAVARDARTYRFLSDTRLGRVVLAESDDMELVSERVTTYVADRMVERERAIEADWQVQRLNEKAAAEAEEAAKALAAAKEAGDEPVAEKQPTGGGGTVLGLVLGALIGAAALAGYLHYAGIVDMVKLLNLPTTFPAESASTETPAPAVGEPATGSETAAPQGSFPAIPHEATKDAAESATGGPAAETAPAQ